MNYLAYKRFGLRGLMLSLAAFHAAMCSAQVAVVTRSYDNGRTGANTAETELTPHLVLKQGMTKAFSLVLTGDDPRVEAQPLYVPDIVMSDNQKHDVIYVFSMSNNIWAFDANTGAPIWQHPVSLGPPFLPKPFDPVDDKNINRSFGILSTPVIDLTSQTIYVVNWLSDQATHQDRTFQVHALRLQDGQPQTGKSSALPIQGCVTNAAGQVITLDQVQKQRSALLLAPSDASSSAHKILYVAITGTETPPPDGNPSHAQHGWVVAFDVDTWRQTAFWNVTPGSFGGGIWEASQGPACDERGYVYLMTSNGGYIVNNGQNLDQNIGTTDFPECFIKLAYTNTPQGGSLRVADWFAPFRDSVRKNWTASEVAPFPEGYDYTDQDLGSAGPILPPGMGLVFGAGKDGVLYVMDRDNLGKVVGDFTKLKVPPCFFTFDPDTNILSYANASPTGNLDFKPTLGMKTHHLHGSPVYWKSARHGGMLFTWGENGTLRAFSVDASGHATLLAHGQELASANLADPENNSLGGMPGAMLALSANGTEHGIIWATAPADGDANAEPVPGIVRAYDAANFSAIPNPDGVPRLRMLWQSSGFTYSKFCPPVVVGGKLLVPTYDGRVDVYVLKPARNSVPKRG
jgi:outer membrane protein assembly factor BamB